MSHDEKTALWRPPCQPNVMERAALTDAQLMARFQEAERGTAVQIDRFCNLTDAYREWDKSR